jgi:hypothetical protein
MVADTPAGGAAELGRAGAIAALSARAATTPVPTTVREAPVNRIVPPLVRRLKASRDEPSQQVAKIRLRGRKSAANAALVVVTSGL